MVLNRSGKAAACSIESFEAAGSCLGQLQSPAKSSSPTMLVLSPRILGSQYTSELLDVRFLRAGGGLCLCLHVAYSQGPACSLRLATAHLLCWGKAPIIRIRLWRPVSAALKFEQGCRSRSPHHLVAPSLRACPAQACSGSAVCLAHTSEVGCLMLRFGS